MLSSPNGASKGERSPRGYSAEKIMPTCTPFRYTASSSFATTKADGSWRALYFGGCRGESAVREESREGAPQRLPRSPRNPLRANGSPRSRWRTCWPRFPSRILNGACMCQRCCRPRQPQACVRAAARAETAPRAGTTGARSRTPRTPARRRSSGSPRASTAASFRTWLQRAARLRCRS